MDNKNESTTENIVKRFAEHALKTINAQLGVEIERNGFDKDKIRRGKQKLVRVLAQDPDNPLFTIENYAINDRAIMAVKWSPSGFSIEVNNDVTANAVKKNPLFGIKKNKTNIIQSATAREVAIEARTQEYIKHGMKKV